MAKTIIVEEFGGPEKFNWSTAKWANPAPVRFVSGITPQA